MRIPKQFYFKNRQLQGDDVTDMASGDGYFSFHAATEEAKDDHGRSRNAQAGATASNNLSANKGSNGHPLVPRLNLPRPDPNDQWREMMAQAQSYEDVESSSL